MYQGPPIPNHIELPLGLELEFLRAVGAGRQKSNLNDPLPHWTSKELELIDNPYNSRGTRSDVFTRILGGKGSSGVQVLPKLIEAFLLGETHAESLRQRIDRVSNNWFSPPAKKVLKAGGRNQLAALERKHREISIAKALASYGLDKKWEVRQRQFLGWGRNLISGTFQLDVKASVEEIPAPVPPSKVFPGYRHLFQNGAIRSGSFREFLLDGSLPYFSRDEFIATGGKQKNLVSEKELVAKLTSKNTSIATMITGPGGQGKTRFARQICALVNPESAFEIEHHVDLDHLAGELRSLREGSFVTIFLDYAEVFPNADQLVQFIQEVESARNLSIRLILCCRASAERTTYSRFQELEPEKVTLGINNVNVEGVQYEEWLAKKILAHFGLLDLEKDCRRLPVIAAFACFLHKSDTRFLKDLKLRRSIAATDRWFSKRLDKLVDRYGSSHLRLAQIVASIPFLEIHKNKILANEEERLLNALRDDKWIEWDGVQYTNAHDFFADTILSQYIFSGGNPTHKLSEVLGERPNAQRLVVQLQSLNRLADHDQFGLLDAKLLVRKWANSCADVLELVAPTLIESKLVQVKHIPDFALDHTSFKSGLVKYTDGHLAIARTVTEVVKKSDPKEIEKFEAENFISILQTIAQQTAVPERILPSFLALNFSSFREITLTRLRSQIELPAMAFVIGALLIHGKIHNEITKDVRSWFDKNSTRWQASIIFNCWDISTRRSKNQQLATPMPPFLFDALKKWCLSRSDDENAHATIQVFLDQVLSRNTSAKGFNQDAVGLDPDYKAVIALATTWLDQFSETRHGIHVCSALLRLYPNGSMVSKYIERIFSSNPDCNPKEASYLFRELRNDPDSRYFLGKYLLSTLARSGADVEAARNLINYWLAWDGDFKSVGQHFFALLENNSTGEQIRFLFQSYDKYFNGRHQLIQDYMAEWLEANATLLEAHYVFSIWVRAKLPSELVAKALNEWLIRHFDHSLSRYFLAFLAKDNQIDLTLVKNFCRVIPRLKNHFMIEAFAVRSTQTGVLPSELIELSERWLHEFGSTKTAGFVLAKLLKLPIQGIHFMDYAMDWLSRYCTDGKPVIAFSGRLIQSILELVDNGDTMLPYATTLLAHHPGYKFAGHMLLLLLPKIEYDPRFDEVVENCIMNAKTSEHLFLEQTEAALAKWRRSNC